MNILSKKKSDFVQVFDKGFAQLRNRAGAIIAGHEWGQDLDKPVVQVKGWVSMVLRERGKLVKKVEGHNIWTNTGREYLALLMSLDTAGNFRNDRVAFLGIGTGSQVEEPGVLRLVQPVAYLSDQFLAPLDVPPTFPLTPTRTTVRYHKIFSEFEITTVLGSQVNVSELGLYTNGRQVDYAVGLRDTTILNADSQTPVAYKTFEPLGKTDALQLEVSWEIRF